MSNSETSSYDSFNSSVTDTLLTSIRSTDDSSVSKIKIMDDELKLIHNFNEKDDYKGQNIRDLTWKVFDNYFNNPLRLTQHHLDSYNHFISFIIPKIIRDYNPIIVKTNYSKTNNKYMDEYHINFGDVYIGKPGIKEKDGKTKMMYPIEARWRNLTYSADLYVDIYQKFIKHSEIKGTPPTVKEYPPTKKVSLRTIPIMVKSKYCPLSSDTGRSQAELGECEYDKCGYFIVKGAEKALICQERKCENKILAFSHSKTQTAYSNTVEISSVPSICSFVRSTQLKLYKKTGNGTIQVFIQRFKNENPFPLFIVFRALGITSDRDIMERILFNPNSPRNKKAFDLLIPSINEASSIQSQEMALLYMANYVSRLPEMKEGDANEEKFRQNYVTQLLKTELFPHVGEDFMKKAWFLGMMAKKLIDTALGIRKYDDRDSFVNKRVSSSGVLMEDLFRNNFNKLIKDIIKEVENYMNNGRIDEVHTSILKKIRASTIESSIRYSLGTGTWGMKSQASSSKKGIAQPLNRLSYSSAISHLRRVNAPRAEKGGKITEPRKLHGTQWGRFCVTGDTIITMSNGDMKNISELKDGDVVMTINPKTLQKEPSRIYEWFYRDCDKLLELTTISGRTIKCTPEHPFLISKDGLMEWKTAGELKENDNFVISHFYDKLPTNGKHLFIDTINSSELQVRELTEMGWIRKEIPTAKMEILARLIGLSITDGTITDKEKHSLASDFYVGEERDALNVIDDIATLGFGHASIYRKIGKFKDGSTVKTFRVSKGGSFATLLANMGAFVGKKTTQSRKVPVWIMNSSLSVKREFLSGFQSGDGCKVTVEKNEKRYRVIIHPTVQACSNETLKETKNYVEQLKQLFTELGIDTKVSSKKKNSGIATNEVRLIINSGVHNYCKYVKTINYRYCYEKERKSAPAIEFLFYKEIELKKREILYEQVKSKIKEGLSITQISKETSMTYKQVNRLSKNMNTKARSPSIEKYSDFIKKYSIGNGLMLSPIVDIKEIEPEKVYDFTTISHNHSFIANGFVTHNCPSETPDGHMVGIVKNMAMMAYITVGSDPETIISVLNEENVKNILDANPYEMDEQVRIFINGDPFGCTSEPERITAKLRALRRKGSLDPYISISWVVQEQEIRIHTEGGRISRPLFVVKNNRLTITPDDFKEFSKLNKEWQDLILEGKIEYLDVQEEDTSMIATYYEDLLANKQDNPTYVHYTHCEIHPSMIFGAAAATIPFVENNQGIRIMYESAQKKQALSVYATNYRDRMDNPGQVLRFPQVPIVSTKLAKYLHERDLPSGENAIVAIACFTGYNQEDSLIMNKGAIDRGLFTSMYYRTYKDSERKNQASLELEKFCKPVKYNPNGTLRTAGTNAASYDLLDENGFVKVGSYVKEGDVIIGKVVPLKNTTENGPKFKDASTTIGPNSSGVVDWVYVNKDSDGYQFVKVRIRSIKIPGIGDKFSSRFGQKGTIGMIYDQEDMPFTADGITPDIIVNPAAIPSRMTIGQLLESVIGKAACIDGFECDATPFSSENVDTPDKLASILQSAGFKKYGTEEMFNGRNGKKFSAKLFIGPTYYQRLKHMSKDKLHARATGPLQLLTRQPPEGRKRDGGFRFGEMERDCMLGHAAMGFLKEKMFDCSDKYAFYVCDECGRIANCNPTRNIFECLACKDSTSFSQVQCPYSSKLFFQELMSMGILPRLFTENEE
jgi:DNA-directed RNA polymerase beta subunit